jgi:hypothetical protein
MDKLKEPFFEALKRYNDQSSVTSDKVLVEAWDKFQYDVSDDRLYHKLQFPHLRRLTYPCAFVRFSYICVCICSRKCLCHFSINTCIDADTCIDTCNMYMHWCRGPFLTSSLAPRGEI